MTSVAVLRGPVIWKLVASWITGVAFGTWIAVVTPGSGWFSALVGTTNVPPTPAPVVVTFLPALNPTHR